MQRPSPLPAPRKVVGHNDKYSLEEVRREGVAKERRRLNVEAAGGYLQLRHQKERQLCQTPWLYTPILFRRIS